MTGLIHVWSLDAGQSLVTVQVTKVTSRNRFMKERSNFLYVRIIIASILTSQASRV